MMATWLKSLGPDMPSVDEVLADGADEATLAPYFGTMARPLNALLRNTTTPTMIEGGVRINVIPGQAQAQLDGRVLPGVTEDQVVDEVRRVIGDGIDISVRLYFPASTGGADHALFRTIQGVMAEIDPGSQVLPYLLGAVSDARHLMRRGVKVCGFVPMREEAAAPLTNLMHGDNERISVTNLGFGIQALYHIVERFCSGVGAP
jgi:acetylornithine deacetylase/succinyl-diaminopimelate desuccinylase-like protein